MAAIYYCVDISHHIYSRGIVVGFENCYKIEHLELYQTSRSNFVCCKGRSLVHGLRGCNYFFVPPIVFKQINDTAGKKD
jgi:hypothetical protein